MKTACVGLNPEACENKASDGIQRLVVQGGLQMGDGGPVLRGTAFGRIRLEDGNGESLLVADVNTGGVLVGQDDFDLPDKPGVRVTGKAVVGTHQDSDMWAATDGFELYSPGSSKAYAMIHRIVHKEDATITGVRVAQWSLSLPQKEACMSPLWGRRRRRHGRLHQSKHSRRHGCQRSCLRKCPCRPQRITFRFPHLPPYLSTWPTFTVTPPSPGGPCM